MKSNMEQDLEVFQEQAVTKTSACETELPELVHQIDIMVNSKKVEWERKMKALEAKMDIQNQELASAQSELDQKGQEVRILQQKLEDLQKTKYEMAQNYEIQLQALRSELSKLTHSYEKLRLHQLKQKKVESRQKCEGRIETPSELSNLYKKLQDMEAGFSEMRNELQSRDALWRKIQLECQQMHTELQKTREYKDMQEMHQPFCVQLTEQLENKNTKLLLLAQSQERQQEELNEIGNHVYREEQSHHSEKERMKKEISDLTEELHQEITIATIMEKASLLERQLKMELDIKDKLLAKQQFLDYRYKVMSSENTHLKEMMETQSVDLCNKQHGNFTSSIHKPEHENVRLQSSLVKLQNDTETSLLGRMGTYGETEHSYQTHSKMKEKEERTSQKQVAWEMEGQQTAAFTGYHRNHSPALYGQGSITGSKSDKYPLGFSGMFPEEGRRGSLLSPAYNAEEIKLSQNLINTKSPSLFCQKCQTEIPDHRPQSFYFQPAQSSPEMSFLATAEKFLQEEEKHTREFEERLNLHLEELQRHSENTLQRYARLQQSRHT